MWAKRHRVTSNRENSVLFSSIWLCVNSFRLIDYIRHYSGYKMETYASLIDEFRNVHQFSARPMATECRMPAYNCILKCFRLFGSMHKHIMSRACYEWMDGYGKFCNLEIQNRKLKTQQKVRKEHWFAEVVGLLWIWLNNASRSRRRFRSHIVEFFKLLNTRLIHLFYYFFLARHWHSRVLVFSFSLNSFCLLLCRRIAQTQLWWSLETEKCRKSDTVSAD